MRIEFDKPEGHVLVSKHKPRFAMNRVHSCSVAILLVICLALAALSLRLHHEMVRMHAEITDHQSAEKKDQREIGELRSKLAMRTPPSSAKPKADASSPLPNDLAKSHPELAAIRLREARRETLRTYGSAFAGLNLSPENLAALKKLLAELQLSGSDTFEAANAAGIEPGTPAFGRAMAQSYADVQKDIEALVGADGWTKLQQAASLSMHQSQVRNSYAYDFEDAGVPLTADQQQTLAQLMNATQNLATRPPGFFKPDPATWLSPSDQGLLVQASQTLSPAQVSVLRNDLSTQQQSVATGGTAISGAGTVIDIEFTTEEVVDTKSGPAQPEGP